MTPHPAAVAFVRALGAFQTGVGAYLLLAPWPQLAPVRLVAPVLAAGGVYWAGRGLPARPSLADAAARGYATRSPPSPPPTCFWRPRRRGGPRSNWFGGTWPPCTAAPPPLPTSGASGSRAWPGGGPTRGFTADGGCAVGAEGAWVVAAVAAVFVVASMVLGADRRPRFRHWRGPTAGTLDDVQRDHLDLFTPPSRGGEDDDDAP